VKPQCERAPLNIGTIAMAALKRCFSRNRHSGAAFAAQHVDAEPSLGNVHGSHVTVRVRSVTNLRPRRFFFREASSNLQISRCGRGVGAYGVHESALEAANNDTKRVKESRLLGLAVIVAHTLTVGRVLYNVLFGTRTTFHLVECGSFCNPLGRLAPFEPRRI
jgi:hypothetical protein